MEAQQSIQLHIRTTHSTDPLLLKWYILRICNLPEDRETSAEIQVETTSGKTEQVFLLRFMDYSDSRSHRTLHCSSKSSPELRASLSLTALAEALGFPGPSWPLDLLFKKTQNRAKHFPILQKLQLTSSSSEQD